VGRENELMDVAKDDVEQDEQPEADRRVWGSSFRISVSSFCVSEFAGIGWVTTGSEITARDVRVAKARRISSSATARLMTPRADHQDVPGRPQRLGLEEDHRDQEERGLGRGPLADRIGAQHRGAVRGESFALGSRRWPMR
jgi:hypothetical protein